MCINSVSNGVANAEQVSDVPDIQETMKKIMANAIDIIRNVCEYSSPDGYVCEECKMHDFCRLVLKGSRLMDMCGEIYREEISGDLNDIMNDVESLEAKLDDLDCSISDAYDGIQDAVSKLKDIKEALEVYE